MAYGDEVAKIEQGASCELFLIHMSDGTRYSYTTNDAPVSYQGRVYFPASIQRSDFSYDTNLKAVKVTVQGAVINPVGEFIAAAPILPVEIEITKVYLSEPDVLSHPLFYGVLRIVKLKDLVMTAEFVSDKGVFERELPRIYYQNDCNNFLFDERCGLQEELFTLSGTIDSIDGNDIVVPEITAADGYYTAGTVIWGGEYRMITNHVGTTLSLVFGIAGLAVDDAVSVLPGCNGKASTCVTKFNNFAHFNGFPYIPNRNIQFWGFK